MQHLARENSCLPELDTNRVGLRALRHKRSSSLGSSEHLQLNFVKLCERYQSHESSFWDVPMSPKTESNDVLYMLGDLSLKTERRESLVRKIEDRLSRPTSLQIQRRRRMSSPFGSKVAKSKLCEWHARQTETINIQLYNLNKWWKKVDSKMYAKTRPNITQSEFWQECNNETGLKRNPQYLPCCWNSFARRF